MQIRPYQAGEERELWQLFYHTIHAVNARDYTPEQLAAWAPSEIDHDQWRVRIAGMNPLVCVAEETIVGYASLLVSGHVDHFYVHHAWQRRGVGARLYQTLEATAFERRLKELTSDVSITARPFFESRGFRVIRPQEVVRDGVMLRNFKMAKTLPPA